MPIKNKPGFVPRSFPFQPDYYTELFGRICAVFTHPVKKCTLYIEVDADVWNHHDNPMNATGDLIVQYQSDCRYTLGSHKTLKGALQQMEVILRNERFGKDFEHAPEHTEHSDRYVNPNLWREKKRLCRKGNGKKFVLTEEDRKELLSFGYKEEDFPQIEEAANRSTFTVLDKDGNNIRVINVWETIEALGRKTFLCGISRSALHWTSARENPETGVEIYFDSTILFDKIK